MPHVYRCVEQPVTRKEVQRRCRDYVLLIEEKKKEQKLPTLLQLSYVYALKLFTLLSMLYLLRNFCTY